jgi:plastocyanin
MALAGGALAMLGTAPAAVAQGPLTAGVTAVAMPGSSLKGFATPVIVLPHGQQLQFVNLDLPDHNVTACANPVPADTAAIQDAALNGCTDSTLYGPDTSECAVHGFGPGLCPLFFSPTHNLSLNPLTSPVYGTESLPAGQYTFYCTVHSYMLGVLVVE